MRLVSWPTRDKNNRRRHSPLWLELGATVLSQDVFFPRISSHWGHRAGSVVEELTSATRFCTQVGVTRADVKA